MTTTSFTESNMSFGPYLSPLCFHIETSETYRHVQEGVQIAEFLLLRQEMGKSPCIWIVEAKSSSPRPETQPSFDGFIEEIRDKLCNALSLGLAAVLKRHPETYPELPEPYRSLDLSAIDFRLVLIINGHRDSWLPPLQDALKKSLHPTVKAWAMSVPAVIVMNDELARKHALVDCISSSPIHLSNADG